MKFQEHGSDWSPTLLPLDVRPWQPAAAAGMRAHLSDGPRRVVLREAKARFTNSTGGARAQFYIPVRE